MSTDPINYITPESESVEAAMKSGDNVKVFERSRRVCFRRVRLFQGFEPIGLNTPKGIGMIYYPGARISPEQYSPIARSLAELGYHVAIVDFALDLAVTNNRRAEDVFDYSPWKDTVKKWIISGHSLGGAMACAYANDFAERRDKLKGIALHAAYPGDGGLFDGTLKGLNLRVYSIFGTNDGLTTAVEIDESRPILPDDTQFVPIEGGNHTQFYYTDKLQDGDNEADISRNDQQKIVREETHKLLLEIAD
eukprot:CAMPEP_0194146166 /NCGR_PEP_ID=MMETSP0152-20130528/20074_1 /TAXON_ID=1049557 /ORGANISM="Thalassiothrix antarctica, Strain L6-D1" /LENGTH=249 /DNA_ID=CAMNT_0038846619 /DNA_START=66 /DNA_END=815 /DNA_ORIENTATION=+